MEQKSIKIGKAGATIYFIGILLSFFTLKNDIVKWIDFAILVIASVLAVAAAAVYTAIYAKQLKALKESGILDTLDRYGRPLPKVEEIGERTDRDDVQSESEQVEDTQER